MAYAYLIISIVTLVLVVVLFIVLLRRKPAEQKVDTSSFQLELGRVLNEIDRLKKDLDVEIKRVFDEEMIKFMAEDKKSAEDNNQKLERFQINIVESLNKRFEHINSQMAEKINDLNKKVEEKLQKGFEGTSETMAQVRERLKVIDEAQKNMESLSKDVVSLRNIMEGNQSRGAYGEYQLEMVLHNVFGDTTGCYKEQFTIKRAKDGNDVRADAVVFMPEPNKMICIDSKFPFQDYERLFSATNEEEKELYKKEFAKAVRGHITVIKDKYILEGKTAPEAIMFIPNDGVFAYIHHELKDVVDYAREKKVILTSPSTLPPILVTINMVRIEVQRAKNAQIITKQIGILGKQFELFAKDWDSFSRQLETASKSREKLDSRVSKINSKFEAISSSSEVSEIEHKEEETQIEVLDQED